MLIHTKHLKTNKRPNLNKAVIIATRAEVIAKINKQMKELRRLIKDKQNANLR